MLKKYKAYVIASYCVAVMGVSGVGVYLGYMFWEYANPTSAVTEDTPEPTDYVAVYAPDEALPVAEPRLASGAVVVYRQHDTRTGVTSERTEPAPVFLVNRTHEHITRTFNSWQVVSFDEQELILEQTIESQPMVAYTMSVSDSHIAIFRGQMSHGNLLEVTTIPVDHLPEVEIARLERGIGLMDRNELIRRLEDFST